MLTRLFLLHSFLLIYLYNRVTCKAYPDRIERYLAVFVLSIANLILTAGVLSAFNKLGNPYLYFLLSSACVIITYVIFVPKRDRSMRTSGFLVKNSRVTFARLKERSDLVDYYLLASLGLTAISMFIVCLSFYPTVHDAITLKLPRIVFNIQDGNVLPTAATDDMRTFLNPLYLYLQWLYFLLYKQSPHFILLYSFLNWLLIGGAVYAIGRELGASQRGSLLATWFLLMTKMMIFHGIESDDIVCATPFVIGVLFLLKWLKHNSTWHAVLSALGIGISLGTKNSGLAYSMAFIILLVYVGIHWNKFEMKTWLSVRSRSIITGLVVFAVIMLPLVTAKILERSSPWAPSPKVLEGLVNKPFNSKCAKQNIEIYGLKFLFSVFPEFVNPTDITSRHKIVYKYNDFFSKHIILKGHPIECNPYSIESIPIAAYDIDSHSTGYGLLAWLIVFSIVFVFIKRDFILKTPFWFGFSFLIWVLTFCLSMIYTGEVQRYWILPVAVVTPLIALWWDHLESKRSNASTIFKFIVALCMMGTSVLAWNAFFENALYEHNLLNVRSRTLPRPYSEAFSDNVRTVVGQAKNINIVHKYGLNLYDYMLMNKDAIFYSKTSIIPSMTNVITFKPKSIINKEAWMPYPVYIPVKLPSGSLGGFAHLGQATYETAYANNLPESISANFQDHFLLFSLTQPQPMGEGTVKSFIYVLGNDENNSDLEFSYGVDLGTNRPKQISGWSNEEKQSVVFDPSAKYLIIFGRSVRAPDKVFRTIYPVSVLENDNTLPADLPGLAADMIAKESPANIKLEGMGPLEGPYPQLKLPRVRWAKKSKVKIDFNNTGEITPLELAISFRPQVPNASGMQVKLNGKVLKKYKFDKPDEWKDDSVTIIPRKGANVIELFFFVKSPPREPLYMLFRMLTLGEELSRIAGLESARVADLVKEGSPRGFTIGGMGIPEGPYPQWNLPQVRWANKDKVTIQFDFKAKQKNTERIGCFVSFRPQVRPSAKMLFIFNKKVIKSFDAKGAEIWQDARLDLSPKNGKNTIELRFEPAKSEQVPPNSLYMLFRKFTLEQL